MAGSLVVKNRPLGHYVLSVFSLLFRDKWTRKGKICISAPSRTIGRVTDLANLLCEKFATNLLRIENVEISKIKVTNLPKVSVIEIVLSAKRYSPTQKVSDLFENFLERVKNAEENPQEFSICELEFILATLLKEGCSFIFSCPNWMDIELKEKGTVKGSEIDLGEISVNSKGDIQYNPLSNSGKSITIENCRYLKSDGVEPALMRMGILQSEEYSKLATEMCQYDDVIVAVDTNMFYKSQVTSALLDSFVGIARVDYLDTPNWITVVASTVSLGELEHKANRKVDQTADTLSYRERRESCRALQEFMEIGSCVDLEGVSMLITGEIPPELDFSAEKGAIIRDEIIRRHLKNFFKNIDFHKGIYFLTQDKICEMFAKAEGLKTFYLSRRHLNSHDFPYNLSLLNRSEDIHNVSELVYELGVQFPLEIACSGDGLNSLRFVVETDWAEKSLEAWENRRVRLTVGFGSKRLKNMEAKLKKELENWKEKKVGLSGKPLTKMDEKIKEIEEKIARLEQFQKETKATPELIEKLKDNGTRIGLNELLQGWKEVNAERHVM